MKKEIVCPVCGGRGFVAWINTTENSCYSGSKTCPNCNGEMIVEVDVTNADHIRSMSDEELATTLYSVFNIDDLKIPFCKNKPECNELLDADKEIPESMCLRCMLTWLKQPFEEDKFG